MEKLSKELSFQILTSYPQKGELHGSGTVGIASYAKNTLLHLKKAAEIRGIKLNVAVLAEILPGKSPENYLEDSFKVSRVWKKNSLSGLFVLFGEILREKNTKILVIEFEVSMFGSPAVLVLLPFLLLTARFAGKRVVFVPHQFISDINDLSGHIGLKPNSAKSRLLNIFIRCFYFMVYNLCTKIIVFEEFFRLKISEITDGKKIVVIPHGVEENKSKRPPSFYRNSLKIGDEFVILYFGFMGWYKGTDWLVDVFADYVALNPGSKLKLVIAGGENPNHSDKGFYLKYCSEIREKARNSKGKIVVTGFIGESDIEKYFNAADIVILPYRTFMSSSGPLSLAFTYGRPVILSEKLSDYALTPDFGKGLSHTGISKGELFFSLDKSGFGDFLKTLDDKKVQGLGRFSAFMKNARNFSRIGEMYLKEIYEDN